jgi:HK97 gp10 family phage protein
VTEEIKVKGLEELGRALRYYVPKGLRKVLQKALAAGAKPIIQDARSRVPVRTGELRRAIFSYVDRRGSWNENRQVRNIGVHAGSRKTKKTDAYYWKWIEFGHAQIYAKNFPSLGTESTGFFGHSVTAYPAHPFLRPAFEAQKYVAMREIIRELQIGLAVAISSAKWIVPGVEYERR